MHVFPLNKKLIDSLELSNSSNHLDWKFFVISKGVLRDFCNVQLILSCPIAVEDRDHKIMGNNNKGSRMNIFLSWLHHDEAQWEKIEVDRGEMVALAWSYRMYKAFGVVSE